MATPSITMIPSGYKADKVYSVLPTNGDGDLTFDRNDTGTRVNKSGLIEQVSTDVPRLDYSDGSCPSLLLEPTSLNLATYSQDFSDTSWSKGSSTVTVNQTTAPSGDLTADKFISTGTVQPRVERSFTVPSTNTTFTYSVFVKKINTPYVAIASYDGSDNPFVIFNLDTKSVVSSNSEGSSIKEMSNGWFRISMTQTVLSTDTFNLWKILNCTALSAFTGVIGDESFIWGAQLEAKSFATSYMPTSSQTQSRSADSALKTGLSSYINQTAGVLYGEFAALSNEDDTYRVFSLSDGTGSDVGRVFIGFKDTNQIYAYLGATSLGSFTPTDATTFNKVAIKYENNNSKLFVNGVQIGAINTTATVPSGLSRLGLDSGNGGSKFHVKARDIRVYNTVLTDAELTTLTTI
tara:strand:+ start:5076 stop:6293 length:1218 start_codon:yes stop_codon:yes gene_type:complete